ncbi:hypothetical protein [Flavobacterium microcysteis]
MNNYIQIIVFNLLTFYMVQGQSINCEVVKDTFIYIEFDVRSSSSYPLIMRGISKSIDINTLSKKNVESFINDFYKKTFYVPEITLGNYKRILLECMGKNEGNVYLKKNLNIELTIVDKISVNSLKDKIELETGETIYLEITKIKGTFWTISKYNNELTTNSSELDIKNNVNIEKCYVSFEIECYIKPKKENVRYQ